MSTKARREKDSLEISVADVKPMAVVDTMDDLLEVPERLGGRELASRNEVVEELASFDVFKNEVPAAATARQNNNNNRQPTNS
jgi:hypothetical protein